MHRMNKSALIAYSVLTIILLYAYILEYVKGNRTFVYIFMLYVIIIPYGDMILCFVTGGVAIIANVIINLNEKAKNLDS